ncbi:Cro/CI family transcriptional regulator [Burkholderia contaminans]|uniref:Cro/CI family transcriptional regulator n=1 Tax=Burkholderia contaminans TaxID=488447 RepID=UPI0024177FDF|nr:Cro/CI family transcriptional regulator [Burkholderia contaminans]WFN14387.1 Cro/CI family transcriptional regulator [Burkholderia contaminans]
MTYADVLRYFHTQTRAAQALGIQQSSISRWKTQGHIPWTRQCHIQVVTRGKLIANKKDARAN